MSHIPGLCLAGLVLGLAVAGVAPAQAAEMLRYRGDNKWVAPADNAALARVMRLAERGQAVFRVTLPATARGLSLQRLAVLQEILTRAAGRPVVLEEVGGRVEGNVIRVE